MDACEPKIQRDTQIPKEVALYNKNLDELRSILTQLEERLNSVLKESQPIPSPGNDLNKIANDIKEAGDRLRL